MRDVRIGAVIAQCPVGQMARNLRELDHWVDKAKRAGVEILCFPEMNICGYSNRSNITHLALPVQSPPVRNLEKLAHDRHMVILAGFAEQGRHGNIYASHVVAKPGSAVETYRKLHLAPPEKKTFTAGSCITVFTYDGITFGIQLCYDAHFPELTTQMAIMGIDILFVPHASPRGEAQQKHQSWMRHLTARAYDNGLFVVACNQTGENGNGLTFPGNGVVLDPSGNTMAVETSGRETMMVVDLSASQLEAVRGHRMRYFLPNRRSDLY